MIQRISRTTEIIAKLKAEGNHMTLDYPEHIEAVLEMNRHLKQVRREFLAKDHRSEQRAALV